LGGWEDFIRIGSSTSDAEPSKCDMREVIRIRGSEGIRGNTFTCLQDVETINIEDIGEYIGTGNNFLGQK
jgi:hypothetical protein